MLNFSNNPAINLIVKEMLKLRMMYCPPRFIVLSDGNLEPTPLWDSPLVEELYNEYGKLLKIEKQKEFEHRYSHAKLKSGFANKLLRDG